MKKEAAFSKGTRRNYGLITTCNVLGLWAVSILSGQSQSHAEEVSRHLNQNISVESHDLAITQDLVESSLTLTLSRSETISYGSEIMINQNGWGNLCQVQQAAIESLITVAQEGINNKAFIVQRGRENKAVIYQNGDDNDVMILQLGNGNIANIVQYGNQSFTLRQFGDFEAINIIQY